MLSEIRTLLALGTLRWISLWVVDGREVGKERVQSCG